ncbi:MAG: hypothetical protein QMC70_03780 [Bacteroidia bacterium]|jgi:hypothetical protein|tara:strand:+ start:11389 stop:11625 length:237 start_codon:yes stop_codon:yes gene_type:complete
MIRNITQNELILLAYNELPPDQHKEMMDVVNGDPKLIQELETLTNQMDLLDAAICKPNSTSVQIIKEESCSSSSMEMI